jgi:hypothetical protein
MNRKKDHPGLSLMKKGLTKKLARLPIIHGRTFQKTLDDIVLLSPDSLMKAAKKIQLFETDKYLNNPSIPDLSYSENTQMLRAAAKHVFNHSPVGETLLKMARKVIAMFVALSHHELISDIGITLIMRTLDDVFNYYNGELLERTLVIIKNRLRCLNVAAKRRNLFQLCKT